MSEPAAEREGREEILDLLASGEPPAFATDQGDRIVFWNRGAERALGLPASQVLGRRCFEIMRGRDVFGNCYCHENCTVVSMTRKGEAVRGFEITVRETPGRQQTINVTVLQIAGPRPELFTVVHILQRIDEPSRLARALDQVGGDARRFAPDPSQAASRQRHGEARTSPLTGREREILRWVAAGLQNKEIAKKLEISLATVKNHIHNILEKLSLHSKLEAVSLAFRQGWVARTGVPER